MKRTTIYLDPSLEMRLKMEGLRRKQPMAELVREAVEVYLAGGSAAGPPGAGAFASGRRRYGLRSATRRSRTPGSARASPRRPKDRPRSGAREPAARHRDRLRLLRPQRCLACPRADAHAEPSRASLILPAPVIPEVDHLLGVEAGRAQPLRLLRRHHRQSLLHRRSSPGSLRPRRGHRRAVRRSAARVSWTRRSSRSPRP